MESGRVSLRRSSQRGTAAAALTSTTNMPPGLAPVATPAGDDSRPFPARSALVDDRGVAFLEFRRQLTPRYGIVWTHLGLGYAALVATGLLMTFTAATLPVWLRVSAGALLFGLAHAFIQLFFHEAAHFNLAPDRTANDRLANACIGALYGLEIGGYRVIHFEHHRRLGTTMDPERSYFDPLNMRFVAEAALAVKVLRVLPWRRTFGALAVREAGRPMPGARRQRVIAIALHLSILTGAALTGHVAVAVSWALGLVSVMPLLASLRQLLEHRSESADSAIDYSRVDHGSVNRLFGDGPFAITFGGAGFNRHLLHHWEPQISYTRLRELESYLLRTSAAAAVEARHGTYWSTFWDLLTW